MPQKLVRVKTVKAALKALEADLAKAHKAESKIVAKDVAQKAEEILDKTLKSRGLGPGGGFSGAEPASEIKVSSSNRGSYFELRVVMSNGGDVNDPHYVWHLIQFGIPARTQRKTSPPIPNKVARTQVDTFAMQPASKQVDEYIVIPAGTEIQETLGRNWYELSLKELTAYVKKTHPGWEIASNKVHKP